MRDNCLVGVGNSLRIWSAGISAVVLRSTTCTCSIGRIKMNEFSLTDGIGHRAGSGLMHGFI